MKGREQPTEQEYNV